MTFYSVTVCTDYDSIICRYAWVCSDVTANKASPCGAAADDDADDHVSDVELDDDNSDAEQSNADVACSSTSGDADVESRQSVVIVYDSDSPASALDHGDDSAAATVISVIV